MIGILATLAVIAAATAPTSTPVTSPPVKEKPICEREAPTGSLIAKRVCHTKAEWNALHNAGQDEVDGIRNAPRQSFCPSNSPHCGS